MSQTFAVAALNVRKLIGDLDLGDPVFDTPFDIYGLMLPTMQGMAAKAGYGQKWVTAAFSSTANSASDVALPSAVQYAAVLEIRDSTNGVVLNPASLMEIERARRGLTSTGPAGGDPLAYYLFEDVDQTVYVRFDRIPSRTISYDVMRSAIATTGYKDATTMPFCEEFCRGIEFAVAGKLLRRATSDQLAKLAINPNFADECKQAEQEGVLREKIRLQRLKGRPWAVGEVVS